MLFYQTSAQYLASMVRLRLFLPSDSDSATFPENTLTNYRISFQPPLEVGRRAEVGLTEISIPKTIYTLHERDVESGLVLYGPDLPLDVRDHDLVYNTTAFEKNQGDVDRINFMADLNEALKKGFAESEGKVKRDLKDHANRLQGGVVQKLNEARKALSSEISEMKRRTDRKGEEVIDVLRDLSTSLVSIQQLLERVGVKMADLSKTDDQLSLSLIGVRDQLKGMLTRLFDQAEALSKKMSTNAGEEDPNSPLVLMRAVLDMHRLKFRDYHAKEITLAPIERLLMVKKLIEDLHVDLKQFRARVKMSGPDLPEASIYHQIAEYMHELSRRVLVYSGSHTPHTPPPEAYEEPTSFDIPVEVPVEKRVRRSTKPIPVYTGDKPELHQEIFFTVDNVASDINAVVLYLNLRMGITLFSYDPVRNRVVIAPQSELRGLMMRSRVASLLGFETGRRYELNQYHVAPYGCNLSGGVDYVCIYAPFIDGGYVGSNKLALLRMIPFESTNGSSMIQHQIYLKPYFYPVSRSQLDVIHIILKDNLGRDILFKSGKVLAVLQFQSDLRAERMWTAE